MALLSGIRRKERPNQTGLPAVDKLLGGARGDLMGTMGNEDPRSKGDAGRALEVW